jgi:sugar/nucleoside kinase (ribokinase family)
MAGVLIPPMSIQSIPTQAIKILSFGKISRDFIIPVRGKPISDIPGGSALYCAVGAAIWRKDRIGVVSQVGDDFPLTSLELLKNNNIDLRGVRILPHSIDIRSFHSSWSSKTSPSEPISEYSKLNAEFPRSLLGYKKQDFNRENRSIKSSITKLDIPPDYFQASAAHICPSHRLSQVLLASLLQNHYFGTITMHISDSDPALSRSDQIRSALRNLTCVMIGILSLKNIEGTINNDYSDLLRAASKLGSEIVVVLLGNQGRLLLDNKSGKQWFIPVYPVDEINPAGFDDSFCGGFISTYRNNYDPLESVICGSVSASIVSQGIGLDYAFHSTPEFLNARVQKLRNLVRKL